MAPRAPAHRDLLTAVVAAVLVLAFAVMCWWQVTRALDGNTLSWAYVFEWPLFAGYVIYMWHRLSTESFAEASGGGTGGGNLGATGPEVDAGLGTATPEEEDEELAAYNRYLAALEESGRRKRW